MWFKERKTKHLISPDHLLSQYPERVKRNKIEIGIQSFYLFGFYSCGCLLIFEIALVRVFVDEIRRRWNMTKSRSQVFDSSSFRGVNIAPAPALSSKPSPKRIYQIWKGNNVRFSQHFSPNSCIWIVISCLVLIMFQIWGILYFLCCLACGWNRNFEIF